MKTTYTRRVLATLALSLLGLGGSALAENGPGKGQVLRIQDYPGVGNTLLRVAASKQFCEKYGIKCQLRSLPNGAVGAQAYMAGELDVAYVGPEIMLPAVSRGADAKVVAGNYAPQPFIVVTRPGMALPNAARGYPALMSDFKGLKVGVPARGSVAETVFSEMLDEAGLSAKDITYVAVGGPATAVPPLVNKQVDVLMLFSPLDGICEVQKVCEIVLDIRKGDGPKTLRDTMGAGIPLWMKAAYIKDNPEALKGLRLAVADALAFVREPKNFDEVVAISATYFQMPGETGAQTMRVALRHAIPGFDNAVKPQALQAIVNYMTGNKLVPPGMKAESLIQP